MCLPTRLTGVGRRGGCGGGGGSGGSLAVWERVRGCSAVPPGAQESRTRRRTELWGGLLEFGRLIGVGEDNDAKGCSEAWEAWGSLCWRLGKLGDRSEWFSGGFGSLWRAREMAARVWTGVLVCENGFLLLVSRSSGL